MPYKSVYLIHTLLAGWPLPEVVGLHPALLDQDEGHSCMVVVAAGDVGLDCQLLLDP